MNDGRAGYNLVMTVLALLLALAAVLAFCLAAFKAKPSVNWIAFGLALLTVAWIVQLLGITHHLHVH